MLSVRAKWVSVAGWWEAKCEMEMRLKKSIREFFGDLHP